MTLFYEENDFIIYYTNLIMEAIMLNFEEELKNYEPSLEIDEAESAIYSHDLTDVTDIIAEILRDQQK